MTDDWRDNLSYLERAWTVKHREAHDLYLAIGLLELDADEAVRRARKIMSGRWPNRGTVGHGKTIHAVDDLWLDVRCPVLGIYNRRNRSVVKPIHSEMDVTCKTCLELLEKELRTLVQNRGLPLHPIMQEILDTFRNRGDNQS